MKIYVFPSNSLLKWDGSYLQDNVYIRNEIRYGTNVYWEVVIKGYTYICLRRMLRDKLPLIADQLKPLFGVMKLGSHQVKYKGRNYMILKVTGPENSDTPLSIPPTLALFIKNNPGYREDPVFVEKVRRVIVYRMILGMTQNHDRNIVVYRVDEVYCPTSMVDTFTPDELKKGDGNVNQAMLTKWFEVSSSDKMKGKCPNQVVSEMFGLYISDKDRVKMPLPPIVSDEITSMKDALSYLYDPIIDTINIFDKNLVWLYSDVVSFINGRASP